MLPIEAFCISDIMRPEYLEITIAQTISLLLSKWDMAFVCVITLRDFPMGNREYFLFVAKIVTII